VPPPCFSWRNPLDELRFQTVRIGVPDGTTAAAVTYHPSAMDSAAAHRFSLSLAMQCNAMPIHGPHSASLRTVHALTLTSRLLTTPAWPHTPYSSTQQYQCCSASDYDGIDWAAGKWSPFLVRLPKRQMLMTLFLRPVRLPLNTQAANSTRSSYLPLMGPSTTMLAPAPFRTCIVMKYLTPSAAS
jgi:hypothetical protein